MAKREHRCEYRELAEAQAVQLAALEKQVTSALEVIAKLSAEVDSLKRRFLGRSSEKMPSPEKELAAKEKPKDAPRTRKKKRSLRDLDIRTETVVHEVPADAKRCPHCDKEAVPIGSTTSTVYDYVPGYLVRQVHMLETCACPCKQHIVRADTAEKMFDKTQFGPGLVAYAIVSKCADAMPIYRLEKQFARAGIPLTRATLNNLVHRVADLLMPLYRALLGEITADAECQADETSCRLQTQTSRAFIWTFLSGKRIAYVFANSRSGDTAKELLGGTTGFLVVDGYTGYNAVTDVDGRERAGCWSHVRRKFFEALPTAPEDARHGLDLILGLFDVERKAKSRGVVGTDEHLAMRRERSAAIVDEIRRWVEELKPRVPPKSPIATALGYVINQWEPLTLFLRDARVPIHNNASEAALRVIALGRKNFLFFGDEAAGANWAALYSLVATCERVGVNPIAYLADVIMRVQTHPASDVAALLPHRWAPPSAS